MDLEDDLDDAILLDILAASDSMAIDDDQWFVKKRVDVDASYKQLNDALIKKRDWNSLRSSMAAFANAKDITELKQQISITLDDGSKDPWNYDEWEKNNNSNEVQESPSVASIVSRNKLKQIRSPSPPRTSPSSHNLPPLFSPISKNGCDDLLAWPLRVKNFLDDENVELYMRSRGTNRINTAPSANLATRFNKLNYIGVAPDSNVPLSQKQNEDMKNIYSTVERRFVLGQRPGTSIFTLESKLPTPDPLEHLKGMSQNFKEIVDEEYSSGVKEVQSNLGMFPEWSNRFTAERLEREHKMKQFKGHMDEYAPGMLMPSFSVASKFNILKDNKWQDTGAGVKIRGYQDGVEHKKMRQERLLKCRHPNCKKMFAYPDEVMRHELKVHYSDDLYFQRSFLKKILLPSDWKSKRQQSKHAGAAGARASR